MRQDPPSFAQHVAASDKAVKRYTGLPSKDVLLGLFTILQPLALKMKYWSGKASSDIKGYEERGYIKPGPGRKMSLYDEFLLTLVRLRLATRVFMLADLFRISPARVSQVS